MEQHARKCLGIAGRGILLLINGRSTPRLRGAFMGHPRGRQHRKALFCGETTKMKSPKDAAFFNVPLREILNVDQSSFVLQKDGKGRVYYNIALQCAPTTFAPGVSNNGFFVRRTYDAAAIGSEVRSDGPNKWAFKVGSYIRVIITFSANQTSHHLAVTDSLAGGVESINFEITKNSKVEPSPFDNQWAVHTNLRDERSEAFAIKLESGEYRFVYYVRAVVPGTFHVPPAKAELMYEPEVNGTSEMDIVTVEV
eukprot:Phypoly_transcript_13470.p1 GENE.Phypoly_transcript_13470~~Phypoly_transcript_13470.p1  ORF type:complete len:253 (+),score=33.72 Phypoly_transcript_13470:235-993(+)